ncbi:MAG: 4Fe-4S binding protein [Chloroflexi bacterium]|nr:4Fe-4S binding protein [Chloroflexota bacterium]
MRGLGRRYRPDAAAVRQSPQERGIFTVQYPEEKLAIPERFRYLPFLLYEPDTGYERCTACGICAKVCPPQCIWIVQAKDENGKALPKASEFYIDMSICMSCGFCAEFCPFDAIKMDHDYELSGYERRESWIYDYPKLLKPTTYYAQIHPLDWAAEEEERRRKEEARAKRAAPAPAAPPSPG